MGTGKIRTNEGRAKRRQKRRGHNEKDKKIKDEDWRRKRRQESCNQKFTNIKLLLCKSLSPAVLVSQAQKGENSNNSLTSVFYYVKCRESSRLLESRQGRDHGDSYDNNDNDDDDDEDHGDRLYLGN